MNEKFTRDYLPEIRNKLSKSNIYNDKVRLLALGTDACFYRLIPQLVIKSANENDVLETLRLSNKYNLPVTFRAAGTSLSGQAISDTVLLIAGKDWENYSVSEDAETITVQCGIIGGKINNILAKYGKKLGPDPASVNSAMIGGIIMNNASGMNCGVHENSYQTIISARIIFADGTILDTGDEISCANFKTTHADFISQIEQLRDKIKTNDALVERIKKKYSIKNTTGLSINAFVDFDDPIQIILHLLVGSEGTLAFGSEFTLRTVKELPYKASAMLYYPDIVTACIAAVHMKQEGKLVYGAELLDRRALSAIEDQPGIPDYIKNFDTKVTALLVETKSESKSGLTENVENILELLKDLPTVTPMHFTDIEAEYSQYWKIRKGVFPSVGSMRPIGTTCFIEDLAFSIETLPSAVADLQYLIDKHGYTEGVIYGHALEGNFHFIVNLNFDSQDEIVRYKSLMEDVVDLVVNKYDGSLKAEHGTGRNMAPFVKTEWGQEAYDIMCEVKKLFDPKGILNPGVIFNDNPECYLENFKSLTPTNKHIDKCIECGFCEVNCLTNGLTLSARQRIVVQREITRLKNQFPKTDELINSIQELESGFKYLGEQTCAGDGLCSTSCPVGINTGELIHDIRAINNRRFPAKQIGSFFAKNFGLITAVLPTALNIIHHTHSVIGTKSFSSLAKGLRYISGNAIPLWTPAMPKGNKIKQRKIHTENTLKVVYFPSCINRTMGVAKDDPYEKSLHDTMVKLLNKAGYEIIYPKNMKNLCCGTIWESKGFYDEANYKSSELEIALSEASEYGNYPILCDQSPCLYRMRNRMKDQLKLYEPVEFINRFMIDKLSFTKIKEPIAIHVTCSMTKMNLKNEVIQLAGLCSEEVILPEEFGCCGFAGDKGFTHPEINRYALRKLKPQIDSKNIKLGFSNSRTCEIGLTTNSGIPYQSIVYLVDQCTNRKNKSSSFTG